MPRSDWRSTVAMRLRRVPLCSALIYALALAPAVHAESVPASIRACTLETDSLKRLICFDRELARYSNQPSTGDAPANARSQSTTPKVLPGTPSENRSDVGSQSTAAAPAATPAAPSAAKSPRHIAARIVSIETFPDALVVHLDNDQVWEQIQEAPADVNLHAGDTVSIDRELGSFWLSGSSGVAMKVKQKK
jgi:hypothetical protein